MSEFVALPHHEEAALWFAKRRRGVMTLEERSALGAWLREPQNAAAMAELERAWEMLQAADSVFAPAADSGVSARRQRIARSALLAAVCAASLGLGVLSYSGNPDFWTTLDWVAR